MLEPLGFRILEAADGHEGIDLARSHHPHLVLMDLVMPRMDGFEAIRHIRDEAAIAGIAVVAISASVANTIRDECLRVGFDDFLPKPFRDSELLRIIRRLLDLEWTHFRAAADLPAAGDGILPPISELQELMQQVASGNIRGIVAAADELATANDDYRAFADRVRALAQNFKINQLSDLVSRIQTDEEASDE
jgi:CheY-like chemotaxis protein